MTMEKKLKSRSFDTSIGLRKLSPATRSVMTGMISLLQENLQRMKTMKQTRSGQRIMPWMVSVTTRARVPPRQMRVMASVRKRSMRHSKVGRERPMKWMCVGRLSIWMKKRAATAGMIMLQSISASDRRPAAKMRSGRL